jgi:hypothetical protein
MAATAPATEDQPPAAKSVNNFMESRANAAASFT